MDEIVKYNPKSDPESILKAMKIHRKNMDWLRITIGILMLSTAIFTVLIGNITLVVVYVFFYLILALIYFFFMFPGIFSFKFKNKKNSYGFLYRMNEFGIEETINSETTFYEWNKFKKSIFQDDMILLYKNSHEFRLFSKKNYSFEEFVQIKEWISNKVKVIDMKG